MPNTLLLADDSVTIQKVVGISFANEDVVLLTVDNGDDAVTKAREARPDLVLADVVMPGKSGYEVCEAIKADPDLQNVPVLLLTGTFEAFDEERATRAGADGHITKPFEAQALVDQVNALLARAAAAAPAVEPEPAPEVPAVEAEPAEAAPAPSYDFFDDDATEPGTKPGPLQSQSAPAPPQLDDLALGETGGQSFRFDTPPDVGDEMEVPALPDPGARGDETVILPAGGGLLPGPEPTTPAPTLTAAEPSSEPTAEPVFDALDEPATLPGATGAATLDPDGGHNYDVSSTDLGDPLSAGPGTPPPAGSPEETVIISEPLVASEPPPEPILAEPPPLPEAPVTEPAFATPPPIPEAEPEPPSVAFDAPECVPEEPPPVAFAEPVAPAEPPPTFEEPLEEPVEAVPAEPPAASFQEPASEEISPVMKEEIRAALEKVAWEAFGTVAESLVKEAIERIERVAWEVVPQLAETLVQEEIRRMKEDG